MESAATAQNPVAEALGRVLASPGFAHNARLSNFLRYVVQQKLHGKADEIKETVIGAEVFRRRPDYDPRGDPIVRMEAAKLRARLAEYYDGPGAADPIRFEIPKGAYVPRWHIGRKPRARASRKLAATIALPVCLVGTLLLVWRWPRSEGKPTIAVLPFVNFSPDRGDEYFADGLTEEITQALSVVEGLEVTSRTSAFALRDRRLDAHEMGGRLNATVLLEGSVRKSGDRLRVTAQLIRAADGKHLWSSTYDRELRDVFDIQEQIADSIANALRLKFAAGRERYTQNLEAYQLYLRGRYSLDGRKPRPARRYFEQAIATDAKYALAYAGLADALLAMNRDLVLPHDEAQPQAKTAAQRALQLDPNLSEAHTALAMVRAREWAWQEAERSFRRAIQLNANNAVAHQELGYAVLVALGRFEEGLAEIQRSLALDPLSEWTRQILLYALIEAGRYTEAADEARKTIVLDPAQSASSYMLLGRALYMQGREIESLTAMKEADRRVRPALQITGWLACAYARTGQRDEAFRLLEENQAEGDATPAPSRRLEQIYACLGDRNRAFEYLEKMYAERETSFPHYLQYPELAWLRPDPRLAELRQRIGLIPMRVIAMPP